MSMKHDCRVDTVNVVKYSVNHLKELAKTVSISHSQWIEMDHYLVGGLEHFLFFHILGTIIPTD